MTGCYKNLSSSPAKFYGHFTILTSRKRPLITPQNAASYKCQGMYCIPCATLLIYSMISKSSVHTIAYLYSLCACRASSMNSSRSGLGFESLLLLFTGSSDLFPLGGVFSSLTRRCLVGVRVLVEEPQPIYIGKKYSRTSMTRTPLKP